MVAENSKIMANNFEGLNQSCVVNIGFAGENKTLSAEELENCAKLLKEKGIDTVLYNTPEAQDSSKTVLTPTGIQSPVLSAEDAKNFTNDVYESINDTYNLAYAYPELGEQMASNSAPELSQEDQDFRNEFVKDKTYDAGLYPTDAYCFDTRAEYEQYKENYQNGNGQMITDTDRLQDAFMKRRNLQNSAKSALTLDDNTIYRGSSVADAYAITSNVENKKCVYATVSAYEALSYTNNSFIPGASGYSGNSVEVNGERIGVGFFHQYEKSQDGQRFYRDYGMENGAEQLNEHQANHTKSETPVFPHKNKLKDSYIALGSHLESYLVKVYENDPRWQKFKELSQVSSPEINDYMSKRKDVQKNELKSNPNYAAKYKLDAENAVEQEEIKEVENVAPTKKKSTLGRWGDKLLNLVKKEADKARKDLKDIAKEVKTEFKATGTEFKELFLMFSLPEHLTNLVSK